MKNNLQFYTRQKLAHRFVQNNFLSAKKFIEFLRKHQIIIYERDLEVYEREKWIQPAFRLINIEQATVETYYRPEDINVLYNDGFIEFPRFGDYEPWSNFNLDNNSGVWQPKKISYYHKFQILQIKNILQSKRFCFTYFDSFERSDLEMLMNNFQREKCFSNTTPSSSLFDKIENIGLLMLLEEPYSLHAFGKITLPTNMNDGIDEWFKWKKQFSANDLLQNSGFSIEQVRGLRDHFATQANRLDPLRAWYDLIRIMKITTIEKLEGEALTAQLYYGIIRMIMLFLHDLTGEKIQEPDVLSGSNTGKWKNSVYSDPFDYGSRKTHRGIIARFIRDPTTRLYLIVEGDTEEIIIKKIFEKWNVNMEDEGICLINSKGIANMRSTILAPIIQSATRDFIAIYMIADNEEKSQAKINVINDSVTTKFDFHVWQKNFEEDNFDSTNVIDLVNSYLRPQGKIVTYEEVGTLQQSGNALIKSIEQAYGKKYEGNLYNNMGVKKPEISLKLMESRLSNTSLTSQVDAPIKIEDVLRKALDLIPSWS